VAVAHFKGVDGAVGEGVIRDVRAKRYFEKPSEVKRRKNKMSAFNNMIRQRYENM